MKLHLLAITLLMCSIGVKAQVDPNITPLVYHIPEMDKVKIEKGLVYKTLKDTTLKFDVYYPSNFDKKKALPLVIFNNGVGGNQVPEWQIYKDWASLIAANGMIAINHQSRQGKTLKDSEDLVDYLQAHATELSIDKDKIGVWACSGNVGAGMPLSMQSSRSYIKALVMYYGAGWRPEDNVIKRQDLEILLVRAGLDFYNLNKGIEDFMRSALEKDAHIEFINYPEGQHAFDAVDNTNRSREIILQTVDFFKRNLSGPPVSELLTTRSLWHMVVVEKQTDQALAMFSDAVQKYRALPNHSPWFNHIIDERNLNQMGYELLNANRFDDAIKVFTSNQKAFVDSPNVYDALGDAYEKAGDKNKAIENSRLALKKLETSTGLPENFKQAIKTSAEDKIKRLATNN
jgi:tetratricopeptide (TPR) repeat protein